MLEGTKPGVGFLGSWVLGPRFQTEFDLTRSNVATRLCFLSSH